jgi:hypothetical protein
MAHRQDAGTGSINKRAKSAVLARISAPMLDRPLIVLGRHRYPVGPDSYAARAGPRQPGTACPTGLPPDGLRFIVRGVGGWSNPLVSQEERSGRQIIVFAVPLAFGVIVGYLIGGRLRNLVGMQLRCVWLLWVALALQLISYVWIVERELRRASEERILVSYLLVAVWLALNAQRAAGKLRVAILVLVVGWALNFAVIATNRGSMPVERDALSDVGPTSLSTGSIQRGLLYKHRGATASTTLRPLDDRLPLATLATVISIGDVLLLVGIAAVVATAMQRNMGSV